MGTTSSGNDRTCERIREDLSRFLDNDLTGRAATDMTVHLESCVGCRHVYDELLAVRTALRAMPAPASTQADAVRARAFARLENIAQAEASGLAAPAPASLRPTSRFAGLFATWRPAVATLAAAVIVGGAVVFLPGGTPQQQESHDMVALPAAPLPGADEMSLLYDLHDSRVGGLTTEDPIMHRSRAADAHAALLDRAETAVAMNL